MGVVWDVANMSETRTISSTGARKGVKEERPDLIPVGPLRALAVHYGRGAEKYTERDADGRVTHDGARNWEAGYEWSKSYAAALRHLTTWWGGENDDPEIGTSHLIAAAWHCFALAEYAETHPEFDDRPVRDEAFVKLAEAIKEAEPKFKVGQKVRITGDLANFSHEFEYGTVGVITEFDSLDGGAVVKSDHYSWWVHPDDLEPA